jgi:hypothetical protein
MMKLLMLMARAKPHIYFLFWKRHVTQQNIEEKKR